VGNRAEGALVQRFSRADDGRVHAVLTTFESELLTKLAGELCALLESEITIDPLEASVGIGGSSSASADPAIARLLPDAYRDDAQASREFRGYTEHSLVDRKLTNARTLIERLDTGGDIYLDTATQQVWLRTLTDLRLVLAARLGIETDDHDPQPQTDEEIMMFDIYDWLGSVQGSLVDVLND
jgi:hypothetical protein